MVVSIIPLIPILVRGLVFSLATFSFSSTLLGVWRVIVVLGVSIRLM